MGELATFNLTADIDVHVAVPHLKGADDCGHVLWNSQVGLHPLSGFSFQAFVEP